LGKVYGKAVQAHGGLSGFHILSKGPEALMMRIALIEASDKSIDMQYFSTHNDVTGKLLLEAVLRAADRGVRVRMLLDDWELDDFEAGAVALNAHPNIELRVFNPYLSHDDSLIAHIGGVFNDVEKFTRRMHNKALIVDNQISVMGGRNLGDEYFDASKTINFRDIDVFVSGPITQQISRSFDSFWNGDEAFPVSTLNLPSIDAATITSMHDEMKAHWDSTMHSSIGQKLSTLPLPREAKHGDVPLIWAKAEFIADNPAKIEQPVEEATSAPQTRIDQLAQNARSEFIIFTPYFVPLDSGVDWLRSLVARGVAVRIITNSLASTDMVPAQAGYGHYREALVKAGVELHEIKATQPQHSIKSMFKPSSQNGLHAKIYMIDRRDLAIGSFNFDPRSIQLNTEQVLVIHSPELCATVGNIFNDIAAPSSSYRVIMADQVPEEERSVIHGALAWVAEEDGKVVYYDFNPHAGFWRNAVDSFFSILPIDNEM
jgi:putative cardiolipin synthase